MSLYEPELLDHWCEHYRQFETQESVRQLRHDHATMEKSPRNANPDPRPDRPNTKAG